MSRKVEWLNKHTAVVFAKNDQGDYIDFSQTYNGKDYYVRLTRNELKQLITIEEELAGKPYELEIENGNN